MIVRIQKIARELNYYPNASAYSLKKKMNHSIALVLPALSFAGGEFFQEIIRGIDSIVDKHGFTLLFAKYASGENSFYRIMKERRIDGAILLGDVFTMQELEAMNDLAIPIVAVNYRLPGPLKNLRDIYTDNEQGGFLAGEHLIRAHGRKKILFLGGSDRYQANLLRERGLRESARRYGAEVETVNGRFETGYKDGESILSDLIARKAFVWDGVFAASDTLAVGALNILSRNHVRVPEEVSLVSYDNTEIAGYYPLPLTSVEQHAYDMGWKATEVLLNLILHPEGAGGPGSIRVLPDLVVRKSCGCRPS